MAINKLLESYRDNLKRKEIIATKKSSSMYYALINVEDYYKFLKETKDIIYHENGRITYQDMYIIKILDDDFNITVLTELNLKNI